VVVPPRGCRGRWTLWRLWLTKNSRTSDRISGRTRRRRAPEGRASVRQSGGAPGWHWLSDEGAGRGSVLTRHRLRRSMPPTVGTAGNVGGGQLPMRLRTRSTG
jgi:hypothetical protein